MTLALLMLAALLTSLLSAVLGLGGGIILMLLLPGLLPLAAVIPVHAVVQLSANIFRAGVQARLINWALVAPLLLGGGLGAVLGSHLVGVISLERLPLISAVVILLFTWVPQAGRLLPSRAAVTALGFYQTFLGMIAGATGPLGAAVMARLSLDRDWIVVNTALYMALNHALRSLAFVLLGFAFAPWWREILAMSATTFFGAAMGLRLRRQIPSAWFLTMFRWLVTLLALRMIALTVWDSL